MSWVGWLSGALGLVLVSCASDSGSSNASTPGLDSGKPGDARVDVGEARTDAQAAEPTFRVTLTLADGKKVLLDGACTGAQTSSKLFSCSIRNSERYKVSFDFDPASVPTVGEHAFVGTSKKPYLTVGWPMANNGSREVRVSSGVAKITRSEKGLLEGTIDGVTVSDEANVVVAVDDGAFLCVGNF